jgi:hypothetical protein
MVKTDIPLREILDNNIKIDGSINVSKEINYMSLTEFVDYSHRMVRLARVLIGREIDGFDTREHAAEFSLWIDSLGVPGEYLDVGFLNEFGKNIYSCGINAFQSDGKTMYYSPFLRCFIPEIKDKDSAGELKIKILGVIRNRHCYENTIVPVPYIEVEKFIEEDDTDKMQHSDLVSDIDVFRCLNFGIHMKENASKKGIKCAVVGIAYEHKFSHIPMSTHVWCAFDTIDRGIVFAEPQENAMIVDEPRIGSNLQELMYQGAERRNHNYIRDKDGEFKDIPDYMDYYSIDKRLIIW